MNKKVKNLFYGWLYSLNFEALNSTDKKLLKLIFSNFEDIYPLGFHGNNTRSAYIIKLIKSKHEEIEELTLQGEEAASPESRDSQFDHIKRLEVESFRGFKAKESFEFSEHYNVIFGKNGAGKSSFFEALEYVLLGDIEEATKRGFDVVRYATNADTGKVVWPRAFYQDKKDKEIEVSDDYEKYQWFFIEKNRINGFARVAANTPAVQTQIISSLFGLDDFNEFVKKFTDKFSIPREDQYQRELDNQTNEVATHKDNQKTEDQEIKRIHEIKKKIFDQYKEEACYNDKVENCDELLVYLTGGENSEGEIEKLEQEISKKQNPVTLSFDKTISDNMKKSRDDCLKVIRDLKAIQDELGRQVDKINLKSLYKAALDVERNIKDKCPLCLTPIKGWFWRKVKKNPYVHSRDQLKILKEASKLEDRKKQLIVSVGRKVTDLKASIDKVNSFYEKLGFKIDLKIGGETLDDLDAVEAIKDCIQSCEQISDDKLEELKKTISSVETENLKIKEDREKLIEVRDYLIDLKEKIEKQDTFLQAALKRKDVASKAIKEFNEKNKGILKKIQKEQKLNKIYEKYEISYQKLTGALNEYKGLLPLDLVSGLNKKVANYYNVINKHDENRSFEQIEKIELPTKSGEKIIVYFKNNPKKGEDALHILSEGHLKCLGLAIIVAKAVIEEVPILILDDIVNAIDDDHRAGVRELIFEHKDIKDKQIILTSHGKMFTKQTINDIKECNNPNKCNEINFVLTAERGIAMVSKNTEHHLLRAKKYLEDGEEYECAKECRYALENMIQKIWKKFYTKKLDHSLCVQLRYRQDEPELRSLVEAINNRIKNLKTKDEDFEKIREILKEILKGNNWNVINRASHAQKMEEEIIEDQSAENVFNCLIELSRFI